MEARGGELSRLVSWNPCTLHSCYWQAYAHIQSAPQRQRSMRTQPCPLLGSSRRRFGLQGTIVTMGNHTQSLIKKVTRAVAFFSYPRTRLQVPTFDIWDNFQAWNNFEHCQVPRSPAPTYLSSRMRLPG